MLVTFINQPLVCGDTQDSRLYSITGDIIFADHYAFIRDADALSTDANVRLSNPSDPRLRDITFGLTNDPDMFSRKNKGAVFVSQFSQISDTTVEVRRYEDILQEFGFCGQIDGATSCSMVRAYAVESSTGLDLSRVSLSQLRQLEDEHKETLEEYLRTNQSFRKVIIRATIYGIRSSADIPDLRSVSLALNTSVAPSASSRDKQRGHADVLKQILPDSVYSRLDWSDNRGGSVRVAEVYSLANLALAAHDAKGLEIGYKGSRPAERYTARVSVSDKSVKKTASAFVKRAYKSTTATQYLDELLDESTAAHISASLFNIISAHDSLEKTLSDIASDSRDMAILGGYSTFYGNAIFVLPHGQSSDLARVTLVAVLPVILSDDFDSFLSDKRAQIQAALETFIFPSMTISRGYAKVRLAGIPRDALESFAGRVRRLANEYLAQQEDSELDLAA